MSPSPSGKSVFTKTFAGMLENNGFISNGSVVFDDPELAKTDAALSPRAQRLIRNMERRLNSFSNLEFGGATYQEILALKAEKTMKSTLSDEDAQKIEDEISDLVFKKTELANLRQTYDPHTEKDKIHEAGEQIRQLEAEIKAVQQRKEDLIKQHKQAVESDAQYLKEYQEKLSALEARYAKETAAEISDEMRERNRIIAKEIYLSVGRYPLTKQPVLINKLLKACRKAMELGEDLRTEDVRNAVFDEIVLRVRYLDEDEKKLHGVCVLNLAKINLPGDWSQIRGGKIATVFQDPMTSLNPIITIGKQITSVILKHQDCSEAEARAQALELMHAVGIPNAENRFDDYPFQYSGGMRQRIVIAIALSCRPKILICDEPTTALDVTIQAQILKLLKDLQKKFNYTIVFITHDLGVVANVADRVAVLYAGQIVELGTVEEVFYDPRHPYTWALLSSLPQLAQKGMKLYSITGTPPSLYNSIRGDAFAPRNPYCLKVDTLAEPPMFQVTETHFAKTWLLDPRAPQIEKPDIIDDIHGKLVRAFNI